MRIHSTSSVSLLLQALVQTAVSVPNCPIFQPSYKAPVLGTGWTARLIAQGLDDPRDNNINKFNFGTNHIPKSKDILLIRLWLNHGIALSNDNKTLYASSSESVYSWTYDAAAVSVSDTNQTLITGMSNDDHTTRTLLMSQEEPGTLIVCRGSNSNIDIEADFLESGHSQIKAFNLNNLTSGSTPYDFTTEGRLLGWGLRNSVGIAEEPLTGGIYSVENSADDIDRNGVDIHENNPGEEMNYHGSLKTPIEWKGNNYGYPNCFALWNTSIPDLGDLITGTQFTMDPNSTLNDTTCSSERLPPRLTFQAHMAPLDIIFTPDGSSAYVSFHGSWDRTQPVGYKVSIVAFSSGSPVAESDSLTAAIDIFSNADNSKCPDGCFRPVGLALDSKDRLFVSSDTTGEIYVLVKSEVPTGTGTSSVTSTTTLNGITPTKTNSAMGVRTCASTVIYFFVVLFTFTLT